MYSSNLYSILVEFKTSSHPNCEPERQSAVTVPPEKVLHKRSSDLTEQGQGTGSALLAAAEPATG